MEKNETDKIEVALSGLMDDEETMLGILNMVKLMKESGNIELLEKLLTENMPSNSKALASLLDKREIHIGGISLINMLLALMASLSSNTAQGAINAILYNSEELWSSMVDGAKQPENFSLFRLMGMMKDPEVAAGLSAMLNALKTLGALLQKVDKE
jgi:Uncharacterized conserved protein